MTIGDVARAVGVSTASVSRVLTGSRPVTPAVAAAVRRGERGARGSGPTQSLGPYG